jgi:hypothetical protein
MGNREAHDRVRDRTRGFALRDLEHASTHRGSCRRGGPTRGRRREISSADRSTASSIGDGTARSENPTRRARGWRGGISSTSGLGPGQVGRFVSNSVELSRLQSNSAVRRALAAGLAAAGSLVLGLELGAIAGGLAAVPVGGALLHGDVLPSSIYRALRQGWCRSVPARGRSGWIDSPIGADGRRPAGGGSLRDRPRGLQPLADRGKGPAAGSAFEWASRASRSRADRAGLDGYSRSAARPGSGLAAGRRREPDRPFLPPPSLPRPHPPPRRTDEQPPPRAHGRLRSQR